jgi:hypothetical protein
MVNYNNPNIEKELPKKYFNINCPNVGSCPEGDDCVKNPMTCGMAREMPAAGASSSGEYGLNFGGLEDSLKDYFSLDNSYSEAGINYAEMTNGLEYLGNSLLGSTEGYGELLKTQDKYDTSTEYQTAA